MSRWLLRVARNRSLSKPQPASSRQPSACRPYERYHERSCEVKMSDLSGIDLKGVPLLDRGKCGSAEAGAIFVEIDQDL